MSDWPKYRSKATGQEFEFVPFNQDGHDAHPQPRVGKSGKAVSVWVTYHEIRRALYVFPHDWTDEQIRENLEKGFSYLGPFEVVNQEERFVCEAEWGPEDGDHDFEVMTLDGFEREFEVVPT